MNKSKTRNMGDKIQNQEKKHLYMQNSREDCFLRETSSSLASNASFAFSFACLSSRILLS